MWDLNKYVKKSLPANKPIKKIPQDIDPVEVLKKMYRAHDGLNGCDCDGCWDAYLYLLFTGAVEDLVKEDFCAL